MPVGEIFTRLDRAVDAGDAEQTAIVVEAHWSHLMRTDAALLRLAVRAVSGDTLVAHPAVALVQEIFAPITAAVIARNDPLLRRVVAGYTRMSDPLARLGAGLAAMIGLTRRGRFRESAALGRDLVGLGLELVDPGHYDGSSVSALELHAGIAHLMAADLARAERYLSAAYRDMSPFANHGLDAAGKLAFLHALRGESRLAGNWLERAGQRDQSATDWWLRATEQQSIAAAHMLLAIDRLDWADYHRHNLNEDMGVPSENWMYVVYARARAALFLGNQRIVIEELHDFRDHLPYIFSSGSLPRMLLDGAELDLLLALGDLDAAEQVLAVMGDHPLERASEARFQLLAGRPALAEQITAEANWPPRVSRRDRLNLLLLGATSDIMLRLNSEARTRMLHQAAVETANEVGPWLFTMATADPSVVELLGRQVPETTSLLERLSELNPPHPFRLVPPPAKLTPREQVLLERLARGGAIQQIAAELHVSPATIRNQRKSLYRKLGAGSRRHAVEIGLRTGLLSAEARSGDGG